VLLAPLAAYFAVGVEAVESHWRPEFSGGAMH
jgi:hypothetical protein